MLASSLKKPKRAFRHSVPNKTPKNVKPPANLPMPLSAVRVQPVKNPLHVAKAEPRRKTASRAHKLAHSPLANLVQPEESQPRYAPVTDISKLQIGQEIKVRAGKSAMDATVLEIAKDGVRVQLSSGLAMIVRAEHLQF